MIDLEIAPSLKERLPSLAVGALSARVRVTEHDPALWQEIERVAGRYAGLTMDQVRQFPPVRAMREAYRLLGNDPTRYRGSSEALLRRLVQGKGLYQVNTLVDINNLISLESQHPAGTFDLKGVEPPVVFRRGEPGESYTGIGRGSINLAGIPLFADRRGPFGSTTSDSERAMVRLETEQMLMVVIAFDGSGRLPAVLDRAAELLTRHAHAADCRTNVFE